MRFLLSVFVVQNNSLKETGWLFQVYTVICSSTQGADDSHIVYCGINDADIGNWELSVTPENSLGLKDGDKVAVRNKDYDVHLQSAVFFVKMFRKNNPNDPDFYMTEDTARCLGIEDAKKRGRFTVSLQLFDNR